VRNLLLRVERPVLCHALCEGRRGGHGVALLAGEPDEWWRKLNLEALLKALQHHVYLLQLQALQPSAETIGAFNTGLDTVDGVSCI
jgi:hypothetical protein